jgi:hypothetical protein
MADEAFAKHRIVPEQTEGPVRMWYCGEKGTGVYSYRVVSAPGMLLVYGDVGDYMLQAYDKDLIPWLQGAIKSEDYVIGKMIHKHKIFLEDEAELMLQSLVDDAYDDEDREIQRKIVSYVRDNWNKEYDSVHEFAKAFYEGGGDAELIDCVMDYESSAYWTFECLKKFVELYNELKSDYEDGICSSNIAVP